ncbi:S9 family peptidase [Ferrimonas balearica]|uniref:S9 family peptidase n=1 Tax=Ferrimonas balearica TaxID=44012 RepID=UPI001C9934BF|nr:S9 family peptidase [Ferrimonas balearica]MBY5991896.1 S9 family peptidase [Ferrimonas balearica]
MSVRALLSLGLALALVGCGSAPAPEQTQTVTPPPLIERSVLFGNPDRFQGRISPDGQRMSFRAPVEGVMNLWVGPLGDFDQAKPITQDRGRGIPAHFWALDGQNVLYIQDQNGDENWHLYRVALDSGEVLDLSPYPGVQAQMVAQSRRHPGKVVVGMNDRDPRWHDLYLVDLDSGARTLLAENTGLASILVDHDLKVRLALSSAQDGGQTVLQWQDETWVERFTIPTEDMLTTSILGFDADNAGVYLLDSRGRDTAALMHYRLSDGALTELASADGVDVSGVLIDPQSHKPFAYAEERHRPVWTAIEPGYETDIRNLNAQLSGGAQVLAITQDARYWTVYTDQSDASPIYKMYDRSAGTLTELFVTQPALSGLPLAKMHGVTITARDGLELISYLTLPREADANGDGQADAPVPLVLLVHGGPWGRDTFGYAPTVQWLANRGYGVLQVNFRASTGFGKGFINAGNKEWGRAMHQDLLDAKAWAVAQGITTEEQVAIMGGSYGGYATLAGITMTPEAFSCGVDIVGPSNLQTLLDSIPPYWESFRRVFANAIGDPETEAGRTLLAERSPINYVDNIARPLLIAQGANDPRVKQAESDQIVEAMKRKGIPVTYVLFPDEGHGFAKPENNIAFYAVAEAFLAECAGGRAQPVGQDFAGSSIQIPHGGEYVPGLDLAGDGRPKLVTEP